MTPADTALTQARHSLFGVAVFYKLIGHAIPPCLDRALREQREIIRELRSEPGACLPSDLRSERDAHRWLDARIDELARKPADARLRRYAELHATRRQYLPALH